MNDTIGKIIKSGYPGADLSVQDHVIWGMTPYPFAKITAKMIYKASSRLFRANKNNIPLCDFCRGKAVPGESLCAKCNTMWENREKK